MWIFQISFCPNAPYSRTRIIICGCHFCSLLKAAEELHLPKRVKREFGGGQKEFVLHESHIFEGVEAEASFFSSQERQWLVLSLLQMLRASAGDEVAGLRLIEGQAIGTK
jgi:anoctamin-8